jgi:glycosyltransferase involved in cell wall biosynthesis
MVPDHAASRRIAVVIPCYRVTAQILGVLAQIGPEVSTIYCVDDACPDGSGAFVEATCRDPRVRVLKRAENGGVGAATLTGYHVALTGDSNVIVKLDGDGQMDPSLIPDFVEPIVSGKVDYVKGNRFYNLEDHVGMPIIRILGNGALSFLTKLSSGYWNIFDPTNGFTAIHSEVARSVVMRPIAKRYFFESDLLFHLYLLRAVVMDMPIRARYGDEVSNLKVSRVLMPFLLQHGRNALQRIFLQFFLRDFSLMSIELTVGLFAILFGVGFGFIEWWSSIASQQPATAGTVMLAALPVIVGIQLVLNALNYDIQNVPRMPVHSILRSRALSRRPHDRVNVAEADTFV